MSIETALLQESYAQLNELVGEVDMYRIYDLYRGCQISFPMKIYDRQKVAQRVKLEYDGHNLADLTQKYDYSQRWIRKMIQA